MTLDRIRELLQGNDVGDLGDGGLRFVDIDTLSEYLRLTVPILRRWTDPTPITPEALTAAGWVAHDVADDTDGVEWAYCTRSGSHSWLCLQEELPTPTLCMDPCFDVDPLYDEPDAGRIAVRTMGQLNGIVDASEGVR